MLLQNIVKSSYFQKCCRDITDWNLLVDEIYYQVKHLEPWAVGTFIPFVAWASNLDEESFFSLFSNLFLKVRERRKFLIPI
jgi:hypothetical protein